MKEIIEMSNLFRRLDEQRCTTKK